MIRDPEKHTPIQRFRLSAETWRRFGEKTGPRRRSAVLAELVRWYLGDGPPPDDRGRGLGTRQSDTP